MYANVYLQRWVFYMYKPISNEWAGSVLAFAAVAMMPSES